MRGQCIQCRQTLSRTDRLTAYNDLAQPLSRRTFSTSSTRQARYIPRPLRPYTFTQLVALSDGSTYLHRTTSPAPVYRSVRDTRNNAMWNPSNARMANVEEDDAGRLKAFRNRFGRGWDGGDEAPSRTKSSGPKETGPGGRGPQTLPPQRPQGVAMPGDPKDIAKESDPADVMTTAEKQAGKSIPATKRTEPPQQPKQRGHDNLMDLINSYGAMNKELPAGKETEKKPPKRK